MIRFSIRSFALLFCFSLLAFAPSALAVDGVTLINQNTLSTGLPGCPNNGGTGLSICKSGSYRLSGDLNILSADSDAMDVNANDVTIDLNGFTISGPVTCQPGTYPVVCSASGRGRGVNTYSCAGSTCPANNVTVRNGYIRGMGEAGIYLAGTGGLVEGVHVEWSGSSAHEGIFVHSGVVIHCTATANAGTGIVGGGVSGASATISLSSASYNGGYGFALADIVSNSSASNNGQDGIFDVFLAVNNTSTYNIGLGLRYDGNGYGYMGNVLYGNSGGTVTSLGTSLGHNLCNSVAC